jgi:hypothetical protein
MQGYNGMLNSYLQLAAWSSGISFRVREFPGSIPGATLLTWTPASR